MKDILVSLEARTIATMLADPSAWETGPLGEFVHKCGLVLKSYPSDLPGETRLFAWRGTVFLCIPQEDQEILLKEHYNPCRRLVLKREADKEVDASHALLEELRQQMRGTPCYPWTSLDFEHPLSEHFSGEKAAVLLMACDAARTCRPVSCAEEFQASIRQRTLPWKWWVAVEDVELPWPQAFPTTPYLTTPEP